MRVVGLAAVCAIATCLTACTKSTDGNSTAPTLHASASTLPAQDTVRLQSALTNPRPAAVAVVLAPEVKPAFVKHPRRLLPAGSELDILSDQMQVSGDTATVPATVTGGVSAGRWLLVLERRADAWLIIGTEKQ